MAELTNAGLEDHASAIEPLFRPVKRRRHYRRRSDEADAATRDAPTATSHSPVPDPNSIANAFEHTAGERTAGDAPLLSTAEILRLRKLARHRRGGIEFAPGDAGSARTTVMHESTDLVHVERDEPPEEIAAIANRFAPQTGQVADVNQHMMAYIDSELARLHHGDDGNAASGAGPSSSGSTTHANPPGQRPRQPATLGKLQEVDLGLSNKLQNIERTEAATKMVGGGLLDESNEGETKSKLGKNGKPWRNRKRRTSEDVKRDQLVEEVLRESRLELYDEQEMANDADDTQAADDRIAEQFRRDFLDAVSSRHRRRFGASKAAAAKAGKKDDRPKGPKLGGSRSARAAMREQQEKAKR